MPSWDVLRQGSETPETVEADGFQFQGSAIVFFDNPSTMFGSLDLKVAYNDWVKLTPSIVVEP